MCRLGLSLFVVAPPGCGEQYTESCRSALSLTFEPNQGQTDARVKFLSRASGYTLFVIAEEAVFAGHDGSVERMKLGANPKPRFEPLDKQPGISNYFIGNDPSKGRTSDFPRLWQDPKRSPAAGPRDAPARQWDHGSCPLPWRSLENPGTAKTTDSLGT